MKWPILNTLTLIVLAALVSSTARAGGANLCSCLEPGAHAGRGGVGQTYSPEQMAQRRKAQEEIEANKEKIRLSPNDVAAYKKLGESYLFLRDYQGAESSYKEVIRLSPNNAGAHQGLARAYEGVGKNRSAIGRRVRPPGRIPGCPSAIPSALHSGRFQQKASTSRAPERSSRKTLPSTLASRVVAHLCRAPRPASQR